MKDKNSNKSTTNIQQISYFSFAVKLTLVELDIIDTLAVMLSTINMISWIKQKFSKISCGMMRRFIARLEASTSTSGL